MPDDSPDFTMRYPAYVPQTPAGTPEIVEIDGNVCLCVFTNRKKVERHHQDKYRPAAGFRNVPVWSFKTSAELAEFLIANEAQFAAQKCQHVAFDVSRGVPPLYTTFRDVVEFLKTGG